jgi:hypothetical protein
MTKRSTTREVAAFDFPVTLVWVGVVVLAKVVGNVGGMVLTITAVRLGKNSLISGIDSIDAGIVRYRYYYR